MIKLKLGDCLERMKEIESNSIDSIITDPPAGIAFMSKDWDKNKGGRDNWIAWLESIMKECQRVLKPGGHMFVWSLPRTNHWTAMAIENAGFEIRDSVQHIFGSGFPKSQNISKAIDKMKGEKRKIIGSKIGLPGYSLAKDKGRNVTNAANDGSLGNSEKECQITSPSSQEAKQWDGWGTALKPAHEVWWLARKPIEEKTIAKNVLKYGTGGINIDESRISFNNNDDQRIGKDYSHSAKAGYEEEKDNSEGNQISLYKSQGRFPSNLILTHHPECKLLGTKKVKGSGTSKKFHDAYKGESNTKFLRGVSHPGNQHADKDGNETVQDWNCHPGCHMKILDKQSGNRPSGKSNNNAQIGISGSTTPMRRGKLIPRNDQGGASRFFKNIEPEVPFYYCSKPSKKERTVNNKVENKHPTVKSVKLMKYLINMITPKNGTVLDPFMGSGSTGIACIELENNFIGIEKEKEYFKIAKKRIKEAIKIKKEKNNG